MKQHITPKQFDELNKNGKEKYRKWYQETYAPFAEENVYVYEDEKGTIEYEVPPLSIGQMIEFLSEKFLFRDIEYEVDMWYIRKFDFTKESDSDEYLKEITNRELCDALWEAVKEVLNGTA